MKREELDLAIRVATLDLIDNLSEAAPFGLAVMAETHAFYTIELCKRFIWDQANGKKLKIDRAITESNKVTRRHFRDKDADELAKMLGYTEEEWTTPISPTVQKSSRTPPPTESMKSEKSPSATDVDATSTETSPSTTTDTPSSTGRDSEPTAPSAKRRKAWKERNKEWPESDHATDVAETTPAPKISHVTTDASVAAPSPSTKLNTTKEERKSSKSTSAEASKEQRPQKKQSDGSSEVDSATGR